MSTLSYLVPPLLGLGLSFQGLRRKSLSQAGAATAFLIGTLSLSSPLRTFGTSLLLFYLLGSRATKIGKERKLLLEVGTGVGEGRRGAGQVAVAAGLGVVAAVAWGALYAGNRWPFTLLGDLVAQFGLRQRAFDLVRWNPLSDRLSRALIYLSLGHFSTCLSDTLASELGILSPSPPLMLTTLRPVPPGTNGGVSLSGTLASVAGGLMMGVIYATGVWIESHAAREDWAGLGKVVLWGTVAGVGGSVLDSLLGATLQETVYNVREKKVVTDFGRRKARGEDEKVLGGWAVLSNVGVNFVSAAVVGIALAWVGWEGY